jgi:hypothetical protein
MASPLAGGPAAAQGNQFVDVHGNSIVMPANYCAPAGPGYGAPGCPPGGGNYCDPMAIDFGGYSEDQIGPHYYDITFGAVFLNPETILDGVGPLASVTAGPAAPRILDPSASLDDYEAGWQIGLRYDLGPLSILEATYMGVYDIGFTDTVNSVDVTDPSQNNQLYTVFSNFGVPIPIDGLDDGATYSLNYKSDLQSTELSYRRYWVGNNPRVSGTYLLGFRYLRLTEDLNFNTVALLGDSNLNWGSTNDVLGFQFGGDGWVGVRQGLRVGCEGKAGIYNNRWEFQGTGDFAGIGNAPPDYSIPADGNKVAFIGEFGANIVADILPSWSLKGGYNAMYIDNLASVAGNIDTTTFVPATINAGSDALYHGFSVSTEYVW